MFASYPLLYGFTATVEPSERSSIVHFVSSGYLSVVKFSWTLKQPPQSFANTVIPSSGSGLEREIGAVVGAGTLVLCNGAFEFPLAATNGLLAIKKMPTGALFLIFSSSSLSLNM